MVLPDWIDQVLARTAAARAERVQALAQVPAVVAALLDDVDLFVQILPYVAGPQPAGLVVERHPPDVAQAVRPGLRSGFLTLDEWIVFRDRVVLAGVLAVHVDAQNTAEQAVQVL